MEPKGLSAIKKELIFYFITALILILTFSVSFQAGWLNWDDSYQVFENPDVTAFTFANIGKIFAGYVVGMYQPVTTLFFSLEYALWGNAPVPFHIVSLLLHFLVVLAFGSVISRFTNQPMVRMGAILLFAIHPVVAEPVMWISSRSTLIFSLFYLLSVKKYLKIADGKNNKWTYLWLYLTAILAMGSKATAITLPVTLVLIDIFLYPKRLRTFHLEKLPLLAFSVVFGLIAINSRGTWPSLTTDLENSYSLFHALLLSGDAVMMGLMNIVAPFFLNPYVSYPAAEMGILPHMILTVVAAAFLFTGLFLRKRTPELLFAYLFFLLNIALTLPVLFISRQFIADRYLYLPAGVLWFAILVALSRIPGKNIQRYLPWATGILAICFLFVTREQAKIRTDSISLWTNVIEKGDAEAQVYLLRADAFLDAGSPHQALDDYRSALKRDPQNYLTYINRAFLRNQLGDYGGALSDYGMALKLNPEFAKAWDARGTILLNMQETEKALKHFEKALELEPQNPEFMHHAGLGFSILKNYEEASQILKEATLLNPENPQYFLDLGNALFYMNEYGKAVEAYTRSITLHESAEACFFRGYTYSKLEDFEKACADMQKAYQKGHPKAKNYVEQWCQ